MTCLFFVISENSDDVSSWLYSQAYVNERDTDQYISSLYFVFSSITTTGYGDIVPVTFSERAFTVLIVVVGVIFFGINVTSVMDQINNSQQIKNIKLELEEVGKE